MQLTCRKNEFLKKGMRNFTRKISYTKDTSSSTSCLVVDLVRGLNGLLFEFPK